MEKKRHNRIVIIGSGNVATHVTTALTALGDHIVEVYSHTLAHAETLAKKIGAKATCQLSTIDPTADFYIYAVSDSALNDVVAQMPECQGIHMHTSGTMPLNIFDSHQQQYGVFYPLLSFSKTATIDWSNVPFFIEGNSDVTKDRIGELAKRLSPIVFNADSETRRTLHLCGVLTNNFSNALYNIADELLKEKNIPFQVLLPLLQQSISKLSQLSPYEAQTGPALRGDTAVTNAHIAMLQQHPRWQEIYKLLTEEIQESHG
ncbi:MAG: DUF2520 domain-containing protein [Bacteroidales bacterium]|nr:DUF2520 domain-containing protein [Bacteroidales bacterium]